MSFYIRKISGHSELFDPQKFHQSLYKAGAKKDFINHLTQEIEQNKELRTTKKIYAYALNQLYQQSPPIAARYNIKHALLQLGPAGFPFEQYIAEVFAAEGYQVQKNQIIHGNCIDHEVDIVINKKNTFCMVECKYHNKQQLKSEVKVVLYTKARFDDVAKGWPHASQKIHPGWIVTNTKFTTQAIQYAECVGIQLLSWNYPADNSLIHLINKYNLHPITALVSLNKYEKNEFIKKGFVMCKDAKNHAQTLKTMGFRPAKIQKIIEEATAVCAIK